MKVYQFSFYFNEVGGITITLPVEVFHGMNDAFRVAYDTLKEVYPEHGYTEDEFLNIKEVFIEVVEVEDEEDSN